MSGLPVRVPDLRQKKQAGEKIAMLTAYDATMARLLDRAGVDVILVGDSLGTVILGQPNTLTVTLEAMIHHTAAVTRGTERALVVADMPFLTYQVSVAEAVRNAGRLLKEGGAAAVKLEGGRPILDDSCDVVDARKQHASRRGGNIDHVRVQGRGVGWGAAAAPGAHRPGAAAAAGGAARWGAGHDGVLGLSAALDLLRMPRGPTRAGRSGDSVGSPRGIGWPSSSRRCSRWSPAPCLKDRQ